MILGQLKRYTRAGQTAILFGLKSVGPEGLFVTATLWPVTAVEVDVLSGNVLSATHATAVLPLGPLMGVLGPTSLSANIKLYAASPPVTFAAENPVSLLPIIGIVVRSAGSGGSVIAYLPFADPVVLNSVNEQLVVSVETGFDADAFYVVARVLPLGE